MNINESKHELEKAFADVKNNIDAVIKSLKQISSEEVLNGSITKAQKILNQILPVEDASKKVFGVHSEFLSIIEKLDFIKTQIKPSKTKENESVSFDDVANQFEEMVEEEILEEEPEKLLDVTSNKEYRLLILKALIYLGGSAKIEEIVSFIDRDMKSKFKTADLERVNGNDVKRWNESVKEERTVMVGEGLLSADSTNGTWEIVQKGIDYLSNQSR